MNAEYCNGGMAMAEGGEVEGDDNKALMEQCALECMHAIENKDKGAFLEAFHCLVADLLNKMQPEEMAEEKGA